MSSMSDGVGEIPPTPEAEESGALAAKVRVFLASRPGASRAELVRFLRDECDLDAHDSRALARAIRTQMASRTTLIASADASLASALALEPHDNPLPADWPLILQRAAFHQVTSLLYVCLERDGLLAGLGMGEVRALRDAFERVANHCRALYAELGVLLDSFTAANVEVIVLKGIALAPALYDRVGARSMVDLDLLVRPGDVERAEGALRQVGYAYAPVAPSIRPPEFLRRFGGSAEYSRAGEAGPLLVDLHWRLTNSEWLRRTTRIEVEDLWATSRPWRYGSLAARQLSPFFQVAHVALHFLKHKFGPGTLRMLADVDRLMRACAKDVNATEWVECARASRISVALYAVMVLSRRLLGTPVPAPLMEGLAPSGARRRALDGLVLRPETPLPSDELGGRAKLQFEFLLTSDARLLAGALWRLLFPEREWLSSRYQLSDGSSGLWRQRLAHPLKVLRSGEL